MGHLPNIVRVVSGLLLLISVVILADPLPTPTSVVAPSVTSDTSFVNLSKTAESGVTPTNTPTPTPTPEPDTSFSFPESFPLILGVTPNFTVQYTPFTLQKKNQRYGFEKASPSLCLVHFNSGGVSSGSDTLRTSTTVLGLALGVGITALTGNAPLGIGVGILSGLVGFVRMEGVDIEDAMTYSNRVTDFKCNDDGSTTVANQKFRFIASTQWEGYGWITDNSISPVNSEMPSCLTKAADNTLSMKSCAFKLVDGQKKVVDPQLWKFIHFNVEGIPGHPDAPENAEVDIMVNKSDNSDCLDTHTSGSACQYYYSGFSFFENGCRFAPGLPHVCTTDQ